MVRLPRPVRISTTSRDTDILTVGVPPLPEDDNSVKPILFDVDVYVSAACTVKIISGGTTLYEKTFAAAGNDHESGLERHGEASNDMVLNVTGAAGAITVTVVAGVGYEFTGGSQAVSVESQR